MAGLLATFPKQVTTVPGSEFTAIQIKAPANQRVKVRRILVTGNGIVNSAIPIQVRVVKQTDAGTGMTSLTPGKRDETVAETIQTTGSYGPAGTTEPTESGSNKFLGFMHPQLGLDDYRRQGDEYLVPGGGYLGVLISQASGQTAVSLNVEVEIEE